MRLSSIEASIVATLSPQPLANPQPNSRLADPWKAFDRIYCITLANRPDRCESARAQFQRVGLADFVEFVIVDKHPVDSELGIFESHMGCLRAALAAGAQKIAIFEDDIIFTPFSPGRIGRAVEFMESGHDWKLFFFGCFVNSSRATRFTAVIKVDYRCAAHAYVVSDEFARVLVQVPWSGIPYDNFLRSMSFGGTYAIYPAIAFQSASATDNDKRRNIDRARRFFGGFRRLQRWNEFSSRRVVPLIIGHVLSVIALLLLVLHHYGWLWR